jgi:hypothetical protein
MKSTILTIILFLSIQSFTQPIVITGTSDNDVIGRTCRTPNGDLITIIERNPGWVAGDLYASISTDDGESWGIPYPIVEETLNQSTFSIVLLNDTLQLFYASNENDFYKIYSLKSVDGMNWFHKKQLDLGWNANQQYFGPMVLVEEDHSLTMVYIKYGGGAYITHCPKNGTWDTEKTLVQSGAYRARICKNNGTYTIAYHRSIGGSYDIHLRNSLNRKNWSPEVDITDNGNSHDAYINTTPDGKYILYYAKHEPMAYNICKRESSNGTDWSEEEFITEDAVNNTQPSFFVEESMIYLTWTHAIDYDTDNDIYFQKFDYLTSSKEIKKLNEPWVFYEQSQQKIIIKNLSYSETVDLVVSDLSGKLVYSNTYKEMNEIIISDLKHLKSGIYVVNLKGENIMFSEKILITH